MKTDEEVEKARQSPVWDLYRYWHAGADSQHEALWNALSNVTRRFGRAANKTRVARLTTEQQQVIWDYERKLDEIGTCLEALGNLVQVGLDSGLDPYESESVSEAACPDNLTPDGQTCPRCGQPRGPSGVGGGSWVHLRQGAA